MSRQFPGKRLDGPAVTHFCDLLSPVPLDAALWTREESQQASRLRRGAVRRQWDVYEEMATHGDERAALDARNRS